MAAFLRAIAWGDVPGWIGVGLSWLGLQKEEPDRWGTYPEWINVFGGMINAICGVYKIQHVQPVKVQVETDLLTEMLIVASCWMILSQLMPDFVALPGWVLPKGFPRQLSRPSVFLGGLLLCLGVVMLHRCHHHSRKSIALWGISSIVIFFTAFATYKFLKPCCVTMRRRIMRGPGHTLSGEQLGQSAPADNEDLRQRRLRRFDAVPEAIANGPPNVIADAISDLLSDLPSGSITTVTNITGAISHDTVAATNATDDPLSNTPAGLPNQEIQERAARVIQQYFRNYEGPKEDGSSPRRGQRSRRSRKRFDEIRRQWRRRTPSPK